MRLIHCVFFALILAGCWGDNTRTDSKMETQGTARIDATMRSRIPSNYTRTDGRRYNIRLRVEKGAELKTPLIVENPAPAPQAQDPAPAAPAPAGLPVAEEDKNLKQNSTENITTQDKSQTDSGLYYIMRYGAYAGFLLVSVAAFLLWRNGSAMGKAADLAGAKALGASLRLSEAMTDCAEVVQDKLAKHDQASAAWHDFQDILKNIQFWKNKNG
jgi:hypothetical protein